MMKQMTFTRSEIRRFTKLLHSRRCDDDDVDERDATSLPVTPMASPQHPTTIDNLSSDLLLKIFIRLLAKEVGQMRSVSKYWNALLSQSSFVKSHLHHSINNNDRILLVFYSNSYSTNRKTHAAYPCQSPSIELPNFIKLPLANPKPSKSCFIHVIGSVHGLICFHYDDDATVIHIWNPALSAVLTLPPSSRSRGVEFSFGFGYDAKADDYKVLKISSLTGREMLSRSFKSVVKEWLQVEVYSMRKGCWKVITQRVPSHLSSIGNVFCTCGVGQEGRLYWPGYIGKEFEPQTILAFDFGSETFREISFPDSLLPGNDRTNNLGVLGGKLCVVSWTWEDEHQEMEVWVMDKSWVKRHVFCYPPYRSCERFYGFTQHYEFIYENAEGHCVLYDPIADGAKIIWKPRPGRHHTTHRIVEHIDSLVWIAPSVK